MNEVRLDKWLWAARFFKTRSLAREAIDGGKIHVEDQRAKPSKTVQIGQTISIRVGVVEKMVVVTALNDTRKSAALAATLYKETPESIAKREKQAEQRKLVHASVQAPDTRPTKKQRRELMNLKLRWED